MTTFDFALAVCALLLTPGPTNTLLAWSGATEGFVRTLRLLPAELSAYLAVVVPLSTGGAEAIASWPLLAQAVKLGAAGWVMYLAVRLWTRPSVAMRQSDVTARHVFVTTLLNPKALIFGLVLLPWVASIGLATHLGLFALLVLAAALLWAAGGAFAVRRRAERRQAGPWLRRAAASWLAVLSLGLAAGTLPA